MVNKNQPLPHLVSPGNIWDIQPTDKPVTGSCQIRITSKFTGILTVPLDESHLSELVRVHELAHAWAGVPGDMSILESYYHPRIVQWAEDLRVAALAEKKGIRTLPCNPKRNCKECDSIGAAFISMAVQDLSELCPNPRKSAGILWRIIRTEPVEKPSSSLLQHIVQYLYKELGLLKPSEKIEQNGSVPVWANMTIHRPALTVDLLAGIPRSSRRMLYEGDDPNDISRWWSDQHIFRSTSRMGERLSILIDGSGSMKWNKDEVTRIIKKVPASIIGTYAGDSTINGGVLYIIASGGKVVNTWPHFPKGNCCDGPALEWLASQALPRYWVSDGEVTNYIDHPCRKFKDEVRVFCKDNKITRVRCLEEINECCKNVSRA